MKYGIPFCSYYGRLCFLHPRCETVALGFCKGVFLEKMQGLLQGDGKEVRHVIVKTLVDIDQKLLQTLLQEAMLLNEMEKKRKKV